MEQLLMNLALNAADAMPEGGDLNITIDTLTVTGDNKLRLVVEDTGIGMDEDTRVKIFEPFFTTKAEDQGTGLGLAVVFSVIEHHSGDITVTSTPGVGTRFEILLPTHRTAHRASRRPKATGSSNTAKRNASESILVVEDNHQVRNLLRLILTAAGYTVFDAADGEIALQTFKAQRHQLDLIVIDAVLPKLGGWELACAIRKLEPQIPVAFTSGYPEDSPHLKLIQQNRELIISKPFSMADLHHHIGLALAHQSMTAELNTRPGEQSSRHQE